MVPCFNEEDSVGALLERVLASDLVGQVIVVDDASTDGTLDIVNSITDDRIEVISQPMNRGKGAALRTGFGRAGLPFVIVQDADLEYDPTEYPIVLEPLLTRRCRRRVRLAVSGRSPSNACCTSGTPSAIVCSPWPRT